MSLPITTWNEDTELIKQSLDVLRQRGVSNSCPRCSTNKWLTEIVALQVSELPSEPYRFLTTGAYVPTLSLTCENCGCIFLHNLINLGVLRGH
jgi:hypothetical protein